MNDCDNEIDTEKDFLFDDDKKGYVCIGCMDKLGDQ